MMEPSMIIRRMEEELRGDYQIEIAEANTYQLHKALSNAVMYAISDNWRRARRSHEHVRRAYYLSAEYLMGRMVFNNLYCLGLLDQVKELLRARGSDINVLEDIEDAALGNGGLGGTIGNAGENDMAFLQSKMGKRILITHNIPAFPQLSGI